MDAGAQGAVPPLQDTMKRVLLVVPGLGVGGVERSLLALLKLAPLTRLDITLLTFVPGGELSGEVPSGVRLACDRRDGTSPGRGFRGIEGPRAPQAVPGNETGIPQAGGRGLWSGTGFPGIRCCNCLRGRIGNVVCRAACCGGV